jgi:hypothetical protein
MPVNNEGEHNRDGQPGCEYERSPRCDSAKYSNHGREDEKALKAELRAGHEQLPFVSALLRLPNHGRAVVALASVRPPFHCGGLPFRRKSKL